jgi:hypothetical protein
VPAAAASLVPAAAASLVPAAARRRVPQARAYRRVPPSSLRALRHSTPRLANRGSPARPARCGGRPAVSAPCVTCVAAHPAAANRPRRRSRPSFRCQGPANNAGGRLARSPARPARANRGWPGRPGRGNLGRRARQASIPERAGLSGHTRLHSRARRRSPASTSPPPASMSTRRRHPQPPASGRRARAGLGNIGLPSRRGGVSQRWRRGVPRAACRDAGASPGDGDGASLRTGGEMVYHVGAAMPRVGPAGPDCWSVSCVTCPAMRCSGYP